MTETRIGKGRRVVVAEFVTLDGFIVGPDEDMSWVIDGFDSRMQEDIAQDIAALATLLAAAVLPGIATTPTASATSPGTTVPSAVRADSTPPTIQDVTIKHRLFSPDGDKRADQVNVHYRFDEPAYAILYVDGKRVARSFRKKPVNAIQWYGHGKRPGDYRLALAAQDLAGNIAPSTREFTVRLRYIDLFKHKFTPHGRILRVRVSTDAKRVSWRLGRTLGDGRPPLLRLPVPAKPGRYTLTVTANGRRARATVVVRR